MHYDFDTTVFHHSLPIQIRFSDMDALNHVNNGFQCHYFDVGRINYMTQALKRDVNWDNQVVVLVHTEFDFLSPIELKDEILVQTKTISFGKRSIKMFQRIIDKNSHQVKTTCYSVLSGMDRQKKCSIDIPQEYKDAFAQMENSSINN